MSLPASAPVSWKLDGKPRPGPAGQVGLAAVLGLAAALAAATPAPAQEDDFPGRTIEFIVPFAAGGNGDIVSRILAEGLTGELGQTVVVENVPGAGGFIGASQVAQAAPDGYTIMLSNNSMTIAAALSPNTPIDMMKNFDHVSQISSSYSVLAVPADSQFNSLQEIVDYAKANPGKLTYASSGVGSGGHLGSALLNYVAGIDLVHIPYQGGPQATTDLIAGRVDMLWLNPSTVMPLIASGELKGVAVASPTRLPLTGDIPPVVETVPEFEYNNWLAVAAPKGIPPAVLAKLNGAIRAVLEDPKYSEKLTEIGQVPQPTTPEELAATTAALGDLWREIAPKTGITIE